MNNKTLHKVKLYTALMEAKAQLEMLAIESGKENRMNLVEHFEVAYLHLELAQDILLGTKNETEK